MKHNFLKSKNSHIKWQIGIGVAFHLDNILTWSDSLSSWRTFQYLINCHLVKIVQHTNVIGWDIEMVLSVRNLGGKHIDGLVQDCIDSSVVAIFPSWINFSDVWTMMMMMIIKMIVITIILIAIKTTILIIWFSNCQLPQAAILIQVSRCEKFKWVTRLVTSFLFTSNCGLLAKWLQKSRTPAKSDGFLLFTIRPITLVIIEGWLINYVDIITVWQSIYRSMIIANM